MAQESLNDIDETEFRKPEGPILCANNCGFFGSPMTNNFCSKCYRDLVINQKILEVVKPPTAASPSVVIESFPEQAKELNVETAGDVYNKEQQNRCLSCRRKVGLTGFKCRCGSTFCSTHRYPELHECSFDYKYAGREAIAKENPVVKSDKIENI